MSQQSHHRQHRPVPTEGQLRWQQDGFGVFFHFGVNTFAGKEWSDGTLPASSFDPSDLDVRQWVRVAASIGARYVILTAKHHDGFCLWPTSTTDYSVASSPWRDGHGDIVAELAAACREAGLGLGLYLSPWDRHAPEYADEARYAEVYARQLTELCTNYGELVELWFDGAGSEGYTYDWPGITAIIERLQPQAMVFNIGAPTIRWVGNENGLAEDPVRYVVDHTDFSNYTVVTSRFEEALYLPPECDVSIRRGWFWHPDDEPKSVEHLLAIFYRSVGLGANLLLNLPPDTRGLLPDADVERVTAWAAERDRRFAQPIPGTLTTDGSTVTVTFAEQVTIDHLRLHEDLAAGQLVDRHEVRTADGRTLVGAGSVGVSRVHVFEPVTTDRLTIELVPDVTDEAGHPEETPNPTLLAVTAFHTGTSTVPELPAGYEAPTDAPD
ncbi:alpha-L-fucosidase [Plantibacter flavus]|uniref:alpha-L-fucosidase n=1 Tax=Plantibacter flavus TaxID=150123 RepID=UPI0009C24838|nr:alpha-L-fucosidase [Plantibacter flavus]AQX81193.1 alpha-L-fucosidase [Plantibacter flavus]